MFRKICLLYSLPKRDAFARKRLKKAQKKSCDEEDMKKIRERGNDVDS
jgi:hypothetical protein